jgi:putative ABC transport system permease protein
MRFRQYLAVALRALWGNKGRSLLTTLGIIIGVGSVIVTVSIVEGARDRVTREFESIGSNLIFAVWMPDRRGSAARRGVFEGLVLEDARAIERECDLLKGVCPSIEFRAPVRVGREERVTKVMGISETANDVLNVEIGHGRSISYDDVEEWRKVCVLGQELVENLFPNGDPLGREVEVRGVRLEVVGILAPKGRAMGENRDDCIYVPLTTVHKRLVGQKILSSILAQAASPLHVEEAADQIWATIRRRHPKNIADFVVDSQASILASIGRVISLFTLVLGGIGGLALLVGGIGIMNIMLVSVTERTREIGLRKAVGARARDILWQFLIEAMTLSGIGGTLGVGFGCGLSWAVGAFMKDKLPTHVPVWSMVLAFSFSAAVGIFFGAYPAWRAAQLDPIEALRHE